MALSAEASTLGFGSNARRCLSVRRPVQCAPPVPVRKGIACEALMTLRQSQQMQMAPPASVVELNAPALCTFLSKKSCEHVTVVYYLTKHCGPCKIAAPVIRRWSSQFNCAHVSFAKMDCGACEENESFANDMGIKAFPTFQVYKGNTLIGTSVGARMMQLKTMIEKHMAPEPVE